MTPAEKIDKGKRYLNGTSGVEKGSEEGNSSKACQSAAMVTAWTMEICNRIAEQVASTRTFMIRMTERHSGAIDTVEFSWT